MSLYVARDGDGSLHLYGGKPYRSKRNLEWCDQSGEDRYFRIEDAEVYKDITWMSEPMEVFLTNIDSWYKMPANPPNGVIFDTCPKCGDLVFPFSQHVCRV